MGNSDETTAHYRVCAPDMHTTIISSNFIFFQDIPGRNISNYQLWAELSEGKFIKTDGNYNVFPVRNKRGRPLDQQKNETSHSNSSSFGTGVEKTLELNVRKNSEAEPNTNPPSTSQSPILNENIDSITSPTEVENKENQITTILIDPLTPKQDSLSMAEIKKSQDAIKPDFLSSVESIPRGSLRSENKRQIEHENSDERNSKRIRAMLAMLDWFDDDNCLHTGYEIAMVVEAAQHNISIPASYEEAISEGAACNAQPKRLFTQERLNNEKTVIDTGDLQ